MNEQLNPICNNCARLGNDCGGTTEQVWTGCVYRKVKAYKSGTNSGPYMKGIRITVTPGENFTPAGLMQRYARETPGVTFCRSYYGEAELTISSKIYRYHHWSITAENGQEVITLYLQEKSA